MAIPTGPLLLGVLVAVDMDAVEHVASGLLDRPAALRVPLYVDVNGFVFPRTRLAPQFQRSGMQP